MNLLLDTHLLLWAAGEPDRLSVRARSLMEDQDNALVFSAASLWEITIKAGLGRADFQIDPHLLRRGLIENGYEELPVTGQHAIAVGQLPDVHRDPFDRILVAQAMVEGLLLLTHDPLVQAYPGPITAV
ncbi:type II toxin-antitoxin system VapC family toxin [Gluconobacter cerinus]|uniref:type II toxin-antitoxin system VapC family toxin n=1 Tax=Gluconobacter cerinus TaxID=38307 RepID=UPI0007C7D5C3|nr:type II toxin-antitoxin system VapC family toxin [Gluconobacter cerinus]MBS0984531.1 type II toxin-antitoxin system VapC family toxin [Gluconobacter cerinus]MBS1026316.1 type II toxin-antitoxin system VapC family toxin [Gluconobacter cerinus]MBS1036067.1 type II toxin-antitoxin system VapC family toxin [Gluconobacter cerinus]OAG71533.1 pilus retraction motor protein PilT [Gluconobacter japonicus]